LKIEDDPVKIEEQKLKFRYMSQQSKLRLIRFEHKQLRIKLNEEKAKDQNLIKNILDQ
jgi:hypothetical protein